MERQGIQCAMRECCPRCQPIEVGSSLRAGESESAYLKVQRIDQRHNFQLSAGCCDPSIDSESGRRVLNAADTALRVGSELTRKGVLSPERRVDCANPCVLQTRRISPAWRPRSTSRLERSTRQSLVECPQHYPYVTNRAEATSGGLVRILCATVIQAVVVVRERSLRGAHNTPIASNSYLQTSLVQL